MTIHNMTINLNPENIHILVMEKNIYMLYSDWKMLSIMPNVSRKEALSVDVFKHLIMVSYGLS